MSAMSVTDIFTRVQRTFGDEAGVQVTEADVIRWINDAQREAVMQNETLLMAETTLDSVITQSEYDLPEDVFVIHHVLYRDSGASDRAYYALRFYPVAEMNDDIPGWNGPDVTGHPTHFTKLTNRKIYLWPAPDASHTGAIKLVYARFPTKVNSNADPIDLPEHLHTYVQDYCMMKAYEMDEDWDASDRKAQAVQSTLDENRFRESWFGTETYPVVIDYEG